MESVTAGGEYDSTGVGELAPAAEILAWDKDSAVPSGPGAGFARGAMPHEASEGVRGLALVRAYVGSWGASLLGTPGGAPGGKVLWAECGWNGPTQPDACAA
ncbi:hypothetical protein [Streptomyces sp. YIM B13518]|uniref:hypothetical protein n=1 Tax=Streptomyces sp. YIM B13518 TaxID=3366316 RepID=UPI0036B7DC5C